MYTKVRSAVEHLNGAIKRVNEAQVAQIAKSLQEEQTRQDAERKAQEQTSDVPKPEVEKQASIERQSSSGWSIILLLFCRAVVTTVSI